MKLSKQLSLSTMQASSLLREKLVIFFFFFSIFLNVLIATFCYFFFKSFRLSLLQAVSREIRKILTERAATFDIALDDVSITNLTFGREFREAIEAKQVAAQDAERAKFVVEKAEQDKRSAVIRAEVSTIK